MECRYHANRAVIISAAILPIAMPAMAPGLIEEFLCVLDDIDAEIELVDVDTELVRDAAKEPAGDSDTDGEIELVVDDTDAEIELVVLVIVVEGQ